MSNSWNETLPDFVAPAKEFGWGAERVSDPAELDAALAECDPQVALRENCLPMRPSGRGHHRVMLGGERRYQEGSTG